MIYANELKLTLIAERSGNPIRRAASRGVSRRDLTLSRSTIMMDCRLEPPTGARRADFGALRPVTLFVHARVQVDPRFRILLASSTFLRSTGLIMDRSRRVSAKVSSMISTNFAFRVGGAGRFHHRQTFFSGGVSLS